jgi:predicted acylesterase/phospholipase RssA
MEILFKYLIDRPWANFFKQRLNSPVDVFDLKGIYGKNLLIDFFLPLFRAKDISIDITMGEFYQLTGKEIHFFTTEFNQFVSVDMSYKTHPSWKLMDCIYCSVSVPFLLSPIICEGACYFDGGMTNNYPIEQCIVDHPGIDADSIFSILLGIEKDVNGDHIVPDMSFLDFTSTLVAKLVKRMIFLNTSIKIKHELVFYQPENPGECLMNIIEHASKRREVLDQGGQRMATHIANL